MSEYTIRVIIEERFGRVVAEACAPMDSTLREVIQPIKVSDGSIPIFDTPAAVIRRVKADRKAYAAVLTPKIAKVLLDSMEAKDLINGYTKEEQEQFYGKPA